jgi:hypothetical protein
MYLCYLDESGVPEIPGNSTHFVLAGIAIPIERWREADASISEIMARYGLAGEELHTAWLLRKYLEQSRIDGFDEMNWDERRAQVARLQVAEIHRVRKLGIAKRNAQLKKVYRHTGPYVHLTLNERQKLASEIAETISKWDWAVLFASCVDKFHFLSQRKYSDVNTLAFTRVIVQFAGFLDEAECFGWIDPNDGDIDEARAKNLNAEKVAPEFGILIHDNNPTVASKHTRLLRAIYSHFGKNDFESGKGNFERIIETPLFVDSTLTRMIQLADLWGYSLRRYVENGDTNLFSILHGKKTVHGRRPYLGPSNIHHFADSSCSCLICAMKLSQAE